MQILRSLPLLVGVAIVASACADGAQQAGPLAPETPSFSVEPAQSAEAAALQEITRMVALAMQDQGLRQRVKNDLRDSRYTIEHKLLFSDYLKSTSGGILLAKMAKESGRSRDEVLSVLGQVRPLEFYMPVDEHRESWQGGNNLLLASLLKDHTIPFGYNLAGEPVLLHAELPPATPTLVIVPVETDFSRELDRSYRNENDQGGNTIGTYAMKEDDCVDCGGGGGTTKPAGVYLTYSYIKDDGEAWAKGNPEIEAHVHGQYTGGGTYGKDLSCAGEKVTNTTRNFNQDSQTWSGEVLLFDKSQVDAYNAEFTEGFNVMMWEDDDTACTLKTDKDITGLLKLTAGMAGAAAVLIIAKPDLKTYVTAAGVFIGTLYESASWLLSNDDFLGDAVEVSPGSYEHRIWIGESNNGTIHLKNLYY